MSEGAATHALPGRPIAPGSTGWTHSIELPDGAVTPGLHSLDEQWRTLNQFPIAEDLSGKRILDVAAGDGWFSFELERRGAHVIALETEGATRILEAKKIQRSKIDVRFGDIAELTWRELGTFDIVLLFDAGRHAGRQQRILENVCGMAREGVCVESAIDDGLESALALAGFARVIREPRVGGREHFVCSRTFEAPPEVTVAAPDLVCLENNKTRDHVFSETADDCINVYFKWEGRELNTSNVFASVSGLGARPVHVGHDDGGWQASVKLPPGLRPGWHSFTLRVADSAAARPIQIGVDVPAEARRFWPSEASTQYRIQSVADGKSFEASRVRVGADSAVSLWVQGLAGNVQVGEVRLRLNGSDLPATWLEPGGKGGARQVNAVLPPGIAPGNARISVVVGNRESVARTINLHA